MTSLDPYSYNTNSRKMTILDMMKVIRRDDTPFNPLEHYHTVDIQSGTHYLYLCQCSGGHYKIGRSARNFYWDGTDRYYRSRTYSGASYPVHTVFWPFPVDADLRVKERIFISKLRTSGTNFYRNSEDFTYNGDWKFLIKALDEKYGDIVSEM